MKYSLTLFRALVIAGTCQPMLFATTLTNDDFESGDLGNWSVSGGNDAGLYENGDVVSNMTSADAEIDYAPNGEFAMFDGRGGSDLQLTEPLQLATQGFTSVTISFNYNFRNGSATRRLRTSYSSDGGATWTELGFVTRTDSITYTSEEADFTFSNNAKFRFAFGDSGGAAGPAFVDDVVIAGQGGSALDTFAGWIAGFEVGDQTGFDDDPDKDGQSNGIESFLGTDPSQFTAGLTEISRIGNVLTFTHSQANPSLSDVTGSYEWSANLTDWFSSGTESNGATVILEGSTDTPDSGTTTVTATTSGTGTEKIFVRAVATQD